MLPGLERVLSIWLLTEMLLSVVGNDLADIEFLHYDLATIQAATNRFSDERKIGQGGFGVVYKVKLLSASWSIL